jgi:hypothetical protein
MLLRGVGLLGLVLRRLRSGGGKAHLEDFRAASGEILLLARPPRPLLDGVPKMEARPARLQLLHHV